MGLRWKPLLTFGLVLYTASSARADWIELKKAGAQRLQSKPIAGCIEQHTDPSLGSPYGFMRGIILNQHDGYGVFGFNNQLDYAKNLPPADLGVLNGTPDKVFLFLPYKWITRAANGGLSWPGPALMDWADVMSVRHEIDTWDDLCTLASWRGQAGPGANPVVTLENGLQAFVNDLDPRNLLKVGGAGNGTRLVLHEGYATRYLLYGTMGGRERYARMKECRAGKGPVGQYGAFDDAKNQATWSPGTVHYTPTDPDWWDETPDDSIVKLVETMARCRRDPRSGQYLYDVPDVSPVPQPTGEHSLRAGSRVVAQFITGRLADAPLDSPHPDARRIRAYSFRARTALLGLIERAAPEHILQLRATSGPNIKTAFDQLRVTNADDKFPATVFDVADAALDVLLYNPRGTGQRFGMIVPLAEDKRRLVDILLMLAAGMRAFNGGANDPDPVVASNVEAIGSKALATLVLLAADPNASGFRDELVDRVANGTNMTIQSAATAALHRVDLIGNNADQADVNNSVDAFLQVALAPPTPEEKTFFASPPASSNYLRPPAEDPRRTDALYMLVVLARSNGHASQVVSDRISVLQQKQKDGKGTQDEKKFLDAFEQMKTNAKM